MPVPSGKRAKVFWPEAAPKGTVSTSRPSVSLSVTLSPAEALSLNPRWFVPWLGEPSAQNSWNARPRTKTDPVMVCVNPEESEKL
jgi:hypothetical protein